LPDRTLIEASLVSDDTEALYEARGHTLRNVSRIGSAMAVYRDPETGVLSGAADPRAEDGGAVAY
jgi:gamma-glutamyltranspeptidase